MKKALIVVFFAALAFGSVAWDFSSQLEGAILSEPTQRIGVYSEPMNLKGVVHYATPDQTRRYLVLKVVGIGSWFLGVGVFLVARRLEKNSGDKNSN